MEQNLSFSSVLEKSDNKLWGCHFVVPAWALAAMSEGNEERRVVCTLNGKATYQCAMLPFGNGIYVITVNKKLQTQLKLAIGAKVEVTLRKDDSEYGLPMPEELAELLRQDDEGDRLLHALTPGKIRTMLYLAGQPKNSGTRLRRAVAIVEHLKENGGKIDFKKLNEKLKSPL
jgi:hypothetical protein